MEISARVSCDGTAVFLARLIVEDLVVNCVAPMFEFGSDAAVRRNEEVFMAVLERLDD